MTRDRVFRRRCTLSAVLVLAALACFRPVAGSEVPTYRSHSPLRALPAPSARPRAEGKVWVVDALRGKDQNAGTQEAPWQSIRHALEFLRPGETLYLRQGVYYENVYLALAGGADAPITIRSYPGEQAVIDGGIREFYEAPERAWEPVPGGAGDEYRSTRRWPNLRQLIGSFGDSMIGLQTYYHAEDLRSRNERADWQDPARQKESDLKPLYCGPGLWYDQQTGYIYLRLAHTHLPEPLANYRGPTDPRTLPLVLAPFRAVPLWVDRGKHLRLQDMVIRGAGYTAVALDQVVDVEFDNVTVWCGTYGIRATGTGPLRFYRSALYGSVAPWTFRSDASKRDYPDRPHRNISRLNTHALLELDAGRESSVYYTPQNDDWEFAYSTFADAHDGLYLGGISLRFHHNLVEDLQDDGIYLSPMYPRHRLDTKVPELHIYQNVFRGVLTALAMGGSEPAAPDRVLVYRNLFDLRRGVQTGRPSTERPEPGSATGRLIGDHGSPPWPALSFYHNTVVSGESARDAAMSTLGSLRAENPRRVFNNIFYHFARLPGFTGPDPAKNCVADGNLYWSPQADDQQAAKFFQRFRASAQFTESQQTYGPGSTANSLVGDPQFFRAEPAAAAANDYRLQAGSPAVDGGVEIPRDWPDPLREADQGKPDIGAIPLGAPPLCVGPAAAAADK